MTTLTAHSMGNLFPRCRRRSQAQAPDNALTLFNHLVLEHQDAAYNLACCLTSDPDLAEDVTQKAFLNAFLHFKDFRGDSFRAWLLKIVRNACYDEFRSACRHPSFSLDTDRGEDDSRDSWLDAHAVSKTSGPEQALEEKEQGVMIHRALENLSPDMRSAIVLVDMEGLDYREAARISGCPLGTIKSRLARGRQQLGALIAG